MSQKKPPIDVDTPPLPGFEAEVAAMRLAQASRESEQSTARRQRRREQSGRRRARQGGERSPQLHPPGEGLGSGL